MEFTATLKEVKGRPNSAGKPNIELKLAATNWAGIDLDLIKALLGRPVRVQIERLDRPLPGMEG